MYKEFKDFLINCDRVEIFSDGVGYLIIKTNYGNGHGKMQHLINQWGEQHNLEFRIISLDYVTIALDLEAFSSQ